MKYTGRNTLTQKEVELVLHGLETLVRDGCKKYTSPEIAEARRKVATKLKSGRLTEKGKP